MIDCITLMAEMFSKTKHSWIGIHQCISISTVGYDFVYMICYQLAAKPQNFNQRHLVKGGGTMTANKAKQYITSRIQDFSASLHPSAMSIIDGET
ncbi:hypothetical protein M9Y10_033796 [Tritrichomonas musculus]|uniref:Uncharacterized protein n=1 Tax=Tritrichomonas musculus TaxID=1915356 RepID=A0ABR2KDX1_9EUKA